MACEISLGRIEPCKDSNGGLKAVYFVNWGDMTGVTYDETNTDAIDGVLGSPSAYKYDLKGNSSFEQAITSSRENGTTFFNQELVLNLKKLTNEMTTQLKLMAWGRPIIFVHTMNGDTLIAGAREGCDLTAGSLQSGAALGDLYGYSITFTGQEQYPAPFVSGSTYGNPFAAVSNPPTIVKGS